MAEVGCVVLAAGAGRRFGGPKQVARVRGVPLLQRVIDIAFDPCVVVLGCHAAEVRATIALDSVQVVQCADWAEGQAASLRCGVAALGDVDAAVVLLGDQPFITSQVVTGAVQQLTPGVDAVRATYRGRPGHPVVLGRAVLEAVPSLRGDVGARALLRSFRVREWEAGHLCDATDIDTRDQLAALA